jgi:dTDP-L-rhamnose 4-epimerase
MKVLVTGGAGFIGKEVVYELCSHGHEVRVLDSLVEQVHGGETPRFHDSGVQLKVADVRDPYAVRNSLAGMDAVVHLAARVGVGQSMYEFCEYLDANVRGTSVLLDACVAHGDLQRLIVASSMSIYGEGPRDKDNTPLPTSENWPPHISSPYALSKYDQERLTMMIGTNYNIATTALRFFNVYGPGQALSNPYTGALAIFAAQLLNGQAPYVYEDGSQLRDFVYVTDVARAVRAALEHDTAIWRTVNVGTGMGYAIAYLAERLAKSLGSGLEPFLSGVYRAGDIQHCYADVTLAGNVLDWRANVSLERGLEMYVGWLVDQIADDRTLTAIAELQQRGLVRKGDRSPQTIRELWDRPDAVPRGVRPA